jgi:hypothetical protein
VVERLRSSRPPGFRKACVTRSWWRNIGRSDRTGVGHLLVEGLDQHVNTITRMPVDDVSAEGEKFEMQKCRTRTAGRPSRDVLRDH